MIILTLVLGVSKRRVEQIFAEHRKFGGGGSWGVVCAWSHTLELFEIIVAIAVAHIFSLVTAIGALYIAALINQCWTDGAWIGISLGGLASGCNPVPWYL